MREREKKRIERVREREVKRLEKGSNQETIFI